jgi:hypothetical protein
VPPPLVKALRPSHILSMPLPIDSKTRKSEILRIAALVFGFLMIILSAFVGPLPGPGGIFVFAFGLSIVLRNSAWAKRRYVHFKKRFPKPGTWADWGLRRKSAKRRDEIAKAGQTAAQDAAGD